MLVFAPNAFAMGKSPFGGPSTPSGPPSSGYSKFPVVEGHAQALSRSWQKAEQDWDKDYATLSGSLRSYEASLANARKAESEAAAAQFRMLRDGIQAADSKSSQIFSWHGRQALENIALQCADVLRAIEKDSGLSEGALGPVCTGERPMVGMGGYGMPGMGAISDSMKALLRDPADRDEYLADAMASLSYLTQSPSSWGGSGTPVQSMDPEETRMYDPLATARLIEQIVKNDCVKQVYVPDPWLVKRFQGETSKVVYRPFLEDDRFRVEISSTKCGEVRK